MKRSLFSVKARMDSSLIIICCLKLWKTLQNFMIVLWMNELLAWMPQTRSVKFLRSLISKRKELNITSTPRRIVQDTHKPLISILLKINWKFVLRRRMALNDILTSMRKVKKTTRRISRAIGRFILVSLTNLFLSHVISSVTISRQRLRSS